MKRSSGSGEVGRAPWWQPRSWRSAAYLEGFMGFTSAPTFGPERRGAPVTASTRISKVPIRMFSRWRWPTSPSCWTKRCSASSMSRGGSGMAGSSSSTRAESRGGGHQRRFRRGHRRRHGNRPEGSPREGRAPLINTPMLGSFAKATGIVSLGNVEKALRSKLPAAAASQNFETVRAAYEGTILKKSQG